MSEFQHIDLENPTKSIAVFNKTEAGLSDLKKRFGVVPDATTKEGYEFIKKAVSELTKTRTAVEKERKRWKAPFLDAGRIIDSEAKRIISAIEEIEFPLKQAKKSEDEKISRQKQERLDKLNEKITWMTDCVNGAIGKTSNEIKQIKDDVEAVDTLNGFYELTDKANMTRAKVLDQLGRMYQQQISFEESERKRLEMEAHVAAIEVDKPIEEDPANVSIEPNENSLRYHQPAPAVNAQPIDASAQAGISTSQYHGSSEVHSLGTEPRSGNEFQAWLHAHGEALCASQGLEVEFVKSVLEAAFKAGQKSLLCHAA